MPSTIVNRQILEQHIDSLLSQKGLHLTPEDQEKLRDEMVQSLDDKIGIAIFSALDPPYLTEAHQLLASENASSDALKNLFTRAGINVDMIMSDAIDDYSAAFLSSKQLQK